MSSPFPPTRVGVKSDTASHASDIDCQQHSFVKGASTHHRRTSLAGYRHRNTLRARTVYRERIQQGHQRTLASSPSALAVMGHQGQQKPKAAKRSLLRACRGKGEPTKLTNIHCLCFKDARGDRSACSSIWSSVEKKCLR